MQLLQFFHNFISLKPSFLDAQCLVAFAPGSHAILHSAVLLISLALSRPLRLLYGPFRCIFLALSWLVSHDLRVMKHGVFILFHLAPLVLPSVAPGVHLGLRRGWRLRFLEPGLSRPLFFRHLMRSIVKPSYSLVSCSLTCAWRSSRSLSSLEANSASALKVCAAAEERAPAVAWNFLIF